jgi:hypothetical protein
MVQHSRLAAWNCATAAHHEGGHVIAGLSLGSRIGRVAIEPDGAGGAEYVGHGPVSLRTANGRRRALRWLVGCYAGPASELRFNGRLDRHACKPDFLMADGPARRLGLSPRDRRVLRSIARDLVAKKWRAIEAVAQALIECDALSCVELEALCFGSVRGLSAAIGAELPGGALHQHRNVAAMATHGDRAAGAGAAFAPALGEAFPAATWHATSSTGHWGARLTTGSLAAPFGAVGVVVADDVRARDMGTSVTRLL